jgi:hypothetical protein
MKAKYIGIFLLAGAILAGCGGGSSSTSGPAPLAAVTIDATNSSKVSYAGISNAALNLKSYSPLAVQTTTSSTDDRDLFTVTDFAMQKILAQQNMPASVTGVTDTFQCIPNNTTSGTYVFTYDTSNNTWITLTFTNCKFSTLSTKTVNGTFSVTNISSTQNASGVFTSLSGTTSIDLTITTTGLPTIKLVGGYTLTETGIGSTSRVNTLAGSSLVYSVGPLNESLTNFSFMSSYDDLPTSGTYRSTYSDIVSYTVSSDFTGGSFTLATSAGKPIVHNATDIYPRSGQVVISGAKSSALRVTVASTDPNAGTSSAATVTLELSTDNGVTYSAPVTKTWAQLAAGN